VLWFKSRIATKVNIEISPLEGSKLEVKGQIMRECGPWQQVTRTGNLPCLALYVGSGDLNSGPHV